MRKKVFVAAALFLLLIMSVAAQSSVLYVKARTANVRSCPRTGCRIITGLRPGTAVSVLETVRGQPFANSSTWYRVRAEDQDGYIHSSLLTATDPGVGALYVTFTPTPNVTLAPITPAFALVQPVATSAGWVCNCSLTCEQILTCDEAYFQLNTCQCFDRDDDSDGVPCENLCA